jgi:HK97 gp10 family phage protein
MSKFRYESNKKKVLSALTESENRALEGIGEFIKGKAKLLAPVDDGNLRSSINHVVDGSGKRVVIGTNVEYAPYQEFGTGRHAEKGGGRQGGWFYKDPKTGRTVFTYGNKPQPFLRPAAEDNKAQITKMVKSLLNIEGKGGFRTTSKE